MQTIEVTLAIYIRNAFVAVESQQGNYTLADSV
jgi:hypothetical protein